MAHRHLRTGLLFAILLHTTIAHAEVRLGLGAGVNRSWYSVSPEPSSLDGHTGAILGGFLEFGLTKIVAVQPGLRYTQKGFASGDYHQTEHYVEVPLLVKAQLRATDKVFPYFIVGPDLGYEAASYFSVLGAAVLFKKLDVALDIGAGVTLKTSARLSVFFQAAFSLGLIDVVDSDESSGVTAKSRGIQVTGGVSIRL